MGANRDHYYNKAKQEGYRSRAAYKLQQLDAAADLFESGGTVVDLGAAPGGWLQVAAERVGDSGTVLGVDRQRIDPVERGARVDTIRADITEAETVDRIVDSVGSVDVVISDLAPDLTGEYDLDHARSVHLARQAVTVARSVLRPGGDVVVKVFDGRDLEDFVADAEETFGYVREIRPDASRDASSELYVVGKGFIDAPVAVGDTLQVTISDTGEQGDGIARVDGFTLFVAGASEGETHTVEVTDVKPRFGFAHPIEA